MSDDLLFEGVLSLAASIRRSPDYQCWKKMLLQDVGNVCERWRESILNFTKDIGERPVGTTLVRIHKSGRYEQANCRCHTRKSRPSKARRARREANGRSK
jgi:hypothetical protein